MGDNAGRRGARWERIKAEVKSWCRRNNRPCCLCGQPIDFTLKWPDKRSFTVQHIKDWHSHPELREDPANLDGAHLDCNSSAGRDGRPSIGDVSEVW